MSVHRPVLGFGCAWLMVFSGTGLGAQPGDRPARRQLAWFLSPDDVLLPISSVEWGRPDRWSFTSRYVHMFTKHRDARPGPAWIHSATFLASPGTDGGRLGVGYHGVLNRKAPILLEARVVLLRTWGQPLDGRAPGMNHVGPELRMSFTGVFNLGAGYYRRNSSGALGEKAFWGVHLGVGM
ncbi:MAG: hypothetical protein HY823_00780 [Acidobacteria bacterium]|nr:hypothetical protein [Acidobacteriota bacterium]